MQPARVLQQTREEVKGNHDDDYDDDDNDDVNDNVL